MRPTNPALLSSITEEMDSDEFVLVRALIKVLREHPNIVACLPLGERSLEPTPAADWTTLKPFVGEARETGRRIRELVEKYGLIRRTLGPDSNRAIAALSRQLLDAAEPCSTDPSTVVIPRGIVDRLQRVIDNS